MFGDSNSLHTLPYKTNSWLNNYLIPYLPLNRNNGYFRYSSIRTLIIIAWTLTNAVPENLKARMKESYDTIADDYAAQFTKEDDSIRLGYLDRLVKLLLDDGKDAANVLELGCGAGIPATKTLLVNEKLTVRITGNDISTSQLALAKTNLATYEDRLTLVENDMLSLSFSDATFDAVTGFYSIVHLPREEQTQLMGKIGKWLKPGGIFLANFSAEELPAEQTDKWLDHEKGWMFWSGWGEEGSVKMVEDAGFEVMERKMHQDDGDAKFVWILARKSDV
jgi:ubiquinone/menaquinone biosynthesis C-methylase UbiE